MSPSCYRPGHLPEGRHPGLELITVLKEADQDSVRQKRKKPDNEPGNLGVFNHAQHLILKNGLFELILLKLVSHSTPLPVIKHCSRMINRLPPSLPGPYSKVGILRVGWSE